MGSKRIGPRMRDAVAYVAEHGPCCILPVARYVGPHGSTNYGYRTVWRAVDAGLIDVRRARKGNGYVLTIPTKAGDTKNV